MTAVVGILYLAWVATVIYCAVVCYQKGKKGFCFFGVFLCSPLCIIGACRLAKPGSSWYLKKYDLDKQRASRNRYEAWKNSMPTKPEPYPSQDYIG